MNKEDHKLLAIESFNKTWDYLDIKSRTKEQDLEMIHCTHSSRYHWGFAGNELNKARGEWQISRVYSVLGMGESALHHAKASLLIVEENNYGDFDLVFGYEAMAHAYEIFGMDEEKNKYLQKGYDNLIDVEKTGDREYCKEELDKLK